MLGLRLCEEFIGKRGGGTVIDFKNRRVSDALDRFAKDLSAEELGWPYPSDGAPLVIVR